MIREASVYDIPRINELGELLHENYSKLNKINEMLDDGYSKVIVYEKDGIILGFISAVHLYDTCDIVDLIVDPKYRRKMVATN